MCAKNRRTHAFFYVIICVENLRVLAASPDAFFELVQAQDTEVDYLLDQIENVLFWDCRKIHELLFSRALEYTHAQAWAIGTAMARCYQETPVNLDEVMTMRETFMMGTLPRLGGDSIVDGLCVDVLKHILKHVL